MKPACRRRLHVCTAEQPQGERLVQKVPHGNWKTVTFIAALRHERVTAPFVLEGAMNGETFKAYPNNSSLRL
jgi:hypothetical protein